MRKTTLILLVILAGIKSGSSQDTLTLFQAIEIGLENNYSIRIQKNELGIAENNNTIGNAGMLPSVDLEVSPDMSVSSANSRYISGTEKNVSNASNNSFTAGIKLSWTLFDGLAMFAKKNTFDILEQIGETKARLAAENTITQIILTYYGIVQQIKLVRVQAEAVDLSMERKNLAEARISIGAGSKMMLLQSTVDLNADSARLLTEMAALNNLKATLNRIMGRFPEFAFEVQDLLSLDENLSYADLTAKLSDQNSELMMGRNNQQAAHLALTEARADRYPSLDLDAAYNFNRSKSQSGFLESNRAYGPTVGLTLSYNLFDGFNTGRNIRNADIGVSSADLKQKETELDLRTTLFSTYENYRMNLAIIRLETSNCKAAKTNVEVAIEKYKLGSISDLELREIQVKYIDAQFQLVLAQYRAKSAETELLRMTGGLFKMEVK
jgi:outer membrane protein TolC